MHVLIVSQYFWPETFRINDIATDLVRRGHQVSVLTGYPNYPSGRLFTGYRMRGVSREVREGVEIVRIPLTLRGEGGGMRLMLNYLSFAVAATVLGPFWCRGRYDLVLCYQLSPLTVGLPAAVLAALRRIPLLFWVQDLWPQSLAATGAVRSPALLRVVADFARALYRRSARILVQSRAFVEPISQLGIAREKLLFLPNSAESFYRPLDPATVAAPAPLPAGLRILFAGNVGAAQGFDTIIDAAALLATEADIHWLIVGEGRELAQVKAEVARRRLTACIRFFGRYPAETMPAWFAHAHVLLASLRPAPVFSLTIPSKLQSYLACGRPVLAALDGEGARIVAEAGAGLTVPAGDARALADAVLLMRGLSDAERESMGRRGREYYDVNFDRDLILDRLENLMKQLIRPRTKGAQ